MTCAPLAAGVALAGWPLSAEAATFNVDSNADTELTACTSAPDDCTLRGALQTSRSIPGPHEITFASSVTGAITLSSGLPPINTTVEIRGPGAETLAIDANHESGIVYVEGSPSSAAQIEISGLTLTHGRPSNGPGGAIWSVGSSDLTIADSVLTDNGAERYGGAIFQSTAMGQSPGSLIIERSELSENFAGSRAVSNARGGAIFTDSELTIRNSTISGNLALASDALYMYSSAKGGGVYSRAPTLLAVASSTITGNRVSAREAFGGGISAWDFTSSEYAQLENSIVAGNASGAQDSDLDGRFTASFSLIGDQDYGTTNEGVPGSNVSHTGAVLGPLADNGGQTRTHAPLPGSPAIDAGKAYGLTTDQRGARRPFDDPGVANPAAAGADGSDIGAFERYRTAVKCGGRSATIVGTARADKIPGTSGRDVIVSLGGADRISSGGGNDLVCSGPGGDIVSMGRGADGAFGAGGPDRLRGGAGNDRLFGDGGRDLLNGGAGRDLLLGGARGDRILGLGGRPDRCLGGGGRDLGGLGCERRRSLP